MFWIPAFAGMTVRCERLPKGTLERPGAVTSAACVAGGIPATIPTMVVSKLLTDDARQLAENWLREWMPAEVRDLLSLGLPEWDDRLTVWRVALVPSADPSRPLGEIQIDPDGVINRAPSPAMVGTRLRELGKRPEPRRRSGNARIAFPPVPNKAILGDCRMALPEFPRTACN